jgi:hypothetical protein
MNLQFSIELSHAMAYILHILSIDIDFIILITFN